MNTVKIITRSLWNYYRDEPSNPLSSDSKYFKYKTSIQRNNYNVDEKITNDDSNKVNNLKYDANKVGKNETEVAIPLKHLINLCRSLNIPLNNCEVELILTWSKICVLADITVNATVNPAIVAPLELKFKITDTKLYVPIVTLSKENDIKLLEQSKTGFKKNHKMEQIQITNDYSSSK